MTPYEKFNATVQDRLSNLRHYVERARAASGGDTSPFEYHYAVYSFAMLSPVERDRFLDYLERIKDWSAYLNFGSGSGTISDLSIWADTQISTWSEDIFGTFTPDDTTF